MISFRLILALGAGSVYVLGYAPFNYWPLSLFAVFILLALLYKQGYWRGFFISWFFGIGLFGSGASWIYNSLFIYGGISSETSTLITGLFCICMALFYGLFGLFYCLFNYQRYSIFSDFVVPKTMQIASFASLWILFELLRTHIYVGFPWLLFGNALVDSPLAHWASVGGVFLIGFLALITIASLFHLLLLIPTIYVFRNQSKAFILLLIILAPWAIGFRLQFFEWTQPIAKPIDVAIIQANTPQELKWNESQLGAIKEVYYKMTREQTHQDLIVWPEAAVPYVYEDNDNFYNPIDFLARQTNTTLIIGSLRIDSNQQTYNSILMAGARLPKIQPVYDKKTLVPFGEYIPLEAYLSQWLNLLDLSVHPISPGTKSAPFQTSEWKIASSICYEITQGQYIARLARSSNFLVTLSNDSWFSDTIGPHQHNHLARMRALENQLYLIRSTNNGVTAVIAPNGKVIAKIPQFQQRILTTQIVPRQGVTLYQLSGDIPMILISVILSLVSFIIYRRNRKKI